MPIAPMAQALAEEDVIDVEATDGEPAPEGTEAEVVATTEATDAVVVEDAQATDEGATLETQGYGSYHSIYDASGIYIGYYEYRVVDSFWDGKAFVPEVELLIYTNGTADIPPKREERVLKEGVDYTIEGFFKWEEDGKEVAIPAPTTNTDSYTCVRIKSLNSQYPTKSTEVDDEGKVVAEHDYEDIDFEIQRVPLTKDTVQNTRVAYDGTAKSVKVVANGTELTEGADYTVVYKDANGNVVEKPAQVGFYKATVSTSLKYEYEKRSYSEGGWYWGRKLVQDSPVDGRVTVDFEIYAGDTSELVSYNAFMQKTGWGKSWVNGGKVAGTKGKKRRMEAFAIKVANGSIKYRAYVQGKGWQGWKSNGATAGTTGKSKRVEAVQIKLDDQTAQTYSVWYRVYSQKYGWLGWAKDGATAGTTKKKKRTEAIQIQVLPKGQTPNGYNPNKKAKR